MRTRDQIEASVGVAVGDQLAKLQIEVLLDVRDLLLYPRANEHLVKQIAVVEASLVALKKTIGAA